MTTRTSTAHADLTAIVHSWADLRDMLDTPAASTWPPAGRMADYQAQLTDDELAELQDQAAAERAERTSLAPGERPVPLRVAVLDTITALDADLLLLADQIASSIQRPAIGAPRPTGSGDLVGLAVRLAATQDAADPRRWPAAAGLPADRLRTSVHAGGRTGLAAATWLIARVDGKPGPFRPLHGTHLDLIAAGARAALRRIEQTLGSSRTTADIARRCPCGGPMVMREGGAEIRDGRPQPIDPEVECRKCGIRWFGAGLVGLLVATADAA